MLRARKKVTRRAFFCDTLFSQIIANKFLLGTEHDKIKCLKMQYIKDNVDAMRSVTLPIDFSNITSPYSIKVRFPAQ